MEKTKSIVPDWLLERYALGELPREQMQSIDERCAVDPDLARRLHALKDSDAAILETYTPAAMAGQIRYRQGEALAAASEKNRVFRCNTIRALSLAGAFAAALLAIFIIMPKNTQFGDDSRENILTKGDSDIAIYRQEGNGYEKLSSGAIVRKGDRFQIKYNAGSEPFGIIFSIDGRGNVTLHYPGTANQTPRLDVKGDVALFDAFELDDAPGFERFFFITAKTEFKTGPVLDAARSLAQDPAQAQAGALILSQGFGQKSFILMKEGK